MATTGPVLRSERQAAKVKITHLARFYGTSRATLWVIERSAIVLPDDAARYRKALQDAIAAKTAPKDGQAA